MEPALVGFLMTATVHAIVGASIASKIGAPEVAIPLAFVSHFFLDKIPHWDPMTNKAKKTFPRVIIESIMDYLFGYVAVILIFGIIFPTPNLIYLLIVAFFSQLPDGLEAPYILTRKKIPFFYHVYKIQHWFHDVLFNARLDAPWGVVTQIITVAVFLLISLH